MAEGLRAAGARAAAEAEAARNLAVGGGRAPGGGEADPAVGHSWRVPDHLRRESGLSLGERMRGTAAEIRDGNVGRFAAGLLNSTLKNPNFWYSTATAATIAGIRTLAVQAGAAEAGEAGVIIAGVIAGGLKDGITEKFFKSKDNSKVLGAILSGAVIGGLTAWGGYNRSDNAGWQGIGPEIEQMVGPAALAGLSTWIRKASSGEFRGSLSRTNLKEIALSAVMAGAFTGLADYFIGKPEGAGVRAHEPGAPVGEAATPATAVATEVPTVRSAATVVPVEAATSTATATVTQTPEIAAAVPETPTPTSTVTSTATPTFAPIPPAPETSTPTPVIDAVPVTPTPTSTSTMTVTPTPETPLVDTSAGARGRYDAWGNPITPTATPEAVSIPTATPERVYSSWDPRGWVLGNPTVTPTLVPTLDNDNLSAVGDGGVPSRAG